MYFLFCSYYLWWDQYGSLCTLPLGPVFPCNSRSFHCYADDSQLFLSLKPNKISALQHNLTDVKDWMSLYSKQNSDKTEVVFIGPNKLRSNRGRPSQVQV